MACAVTHHDGGVLQQLVPTQGQLRPGQGVGWRHTKAKSERTHVDRPVAAAGRAIAGQSPDATEAAIVAVRKALARYVRGQSVSVPSSFWIATAVDP